jgi:phage gpG-like protein
MADQFERQAAGFRAAPAAAAIAAVPVMVEEARAVFGRTPPLAALRDATVASKAQRGALMPDAPLIDTGALRESVGGVAVGNIASAGSNDPLITIHEFGTVNIPPRSTIRISMLVSQPIVLRIWNRIIGRVIGGPER